MRHEHHEVFRHLADLNNQFNRNLLYTKYSILITTYYLGTSYFADSHIDTCSGMVLSSSLLTLLDVRVTRSSASPLDLVLPSRAGLPRQPLRASMRCPLHHGRQLQPAQPRSRASSPAGSPSLQLAANNPSSLSTLPSSSTRLSTRLSALLPAPLSMALLVKR